jgi:hypothetical protein
VQFPANFIFLLDSPSAQLLTFFKSNLFAIRMLQNLVVAHVGVSSQETVMKGASVVNLYHDFFYFELINLLTYF